MDDLHYGHYNELVETGFAYLHGKISIGLFEETINRVFSALRDGEGKFKALELPEELKTQLKEDLAKVEQGFRLFEEGIEKVRLFVDNRDKAELWNGLSLVKFGCDLLNEAMKNQEKHFNGNA